MSANYLLVVCRSLRRFAEIICKTRGMAPKNTPQFASRIREAVAASGLTQVQIMERGGPSDTTLRKIMEGEEVGISAMTMRKLDAGLGWKPGSSVRVYQGGEPTTLTPAAAQSAQSRSVLEAALEQSLRLMREGRSDEIPRGHLRDIANELTVERFISRLRLLPLATQAQVAQMSGRLIDELAKGRSPISILPILRQGESDDQSQQPSTSGSTPQAPESKKTDAGDPREEDYDLAARDTGGISEGEQTRRDMDQQGEAPDPEGPEDGA